MLGNLFFHQIVQSFAFKLIVYGSICLCNYLALKMQSQHYVMIYDIWLQLMVPSRSLRLSGFLVFGRNNAPLQLGWTKADQ